MLDNGKPAMLDEPTVQALVATLYDDSLVIKSDLTTTLFNLTLPSGTVLKLDDSSSSNGLDGYHGSFHMTRNGKRVKLYYSANICSEILATGRQNGITVFNSPWKNVVGTLYYEFCTDADVKDAIQNRNNDFLVWTSRRGHEVRGSTSSRPVSWAT